VVRKAEFSQSMVVCQPVQRSGMGQFPSWPSLVVMKSGESPEAKLPRTAKSLLRFPCVVLFAMDIGMVF
jgi:hypothetical protein